MLQIRDKTSKEKDFYRNINNKGNERDSYISPDT